MAATALVLMSMIGSVVVAEDTSGGRWYVVGSLGAATGLDLCSAFTPGFSMTPGSCDKSEVAGKLGGFAWRIYNDTGTGFDHNENGISFAMGADVKYDITNRVGIRFEWERFWDVGNSVVSSSDVDMFTLGGLYRF